MGSAGAAPTQTPKHPPAAQEQGLSSSPAGKLLCGLRHIPAFSGPGILFMPRRPRSCCLRPTPFSGLWKGTLTGRRWLHSACEVLASSQDRALGGWGPASAISNLTSRDCGPVPGAQNQLPGAFQEGPNRLANL